MPDNWGDTAASLAALSAAASDAISAASCMSLPRHTAAARAPMNVSPHLKPEETRAGGRGVTYRNRCIMIEAKHSVSVLR